MQVDGRCHCGFITYEAEVDPEKVEICHCTGCQTLSESAFRTVVPAEGKDFKLLSGRPKSYIKTAESGNKRVQVFCPECGTPIYSADVGVTPKDVGIRVGTLRQRDRLSPTFQIWFRSAQRWVTGIESLQKFEKE